MALDSRAHGKEECREVLLNYINESYCWGSGPAKNCEVVYNQAYGSFLCKLETFVETRSSSLVCVSYKNDDHHLGLKGEGDVPPHMDYGATTDRALHERGDSP